jgi:hypothetical protein
VLAVLLPALSGYQLRANQAGWKGAVAGWSVLACQLLVQLWSLLTLTLQIPFVIDLLLHQGKGVDYFDCQKRA